MALGIQLRKAHVGSEHKHWMEGMDQIQLYLAHTNTQSSLYSGFKMPPGYDREREENNKPLVQTC